jgi:hypothetical protein
VWSAQNRELQAQLRVLQQMQQAQVHLQVLLSLLALPFSSLHYCYTVVTLL